MAGRIAGRLVAAGLLAAALSGCGPKTDLLDQDTHLGYDDLKRGKLAPLAAVTTEGDPDAREPLLRQMDGALLARRDLRMIRADDLRRDLGPDVHEQLVERFERSGRLRDSDLALLDSLVGSKIRYVALARVEDEDTDREETFDADQGTTTRTAILQIRVAFSVYDLQATRRVWSATITGEDANSASESDGSPLGSIVDAIVGAIFGHGKEPEPPDRDDMLQKIFIQFARKLPGR